MSDQGDTPDQASQAAAGPMEGRRPIRVMLRRNRGGAYEILIRRRLIQSFCSEFESITRWTMPMDTQRQVRIEIIPSGEAHVAMYPDQEPDREPQISADREQPILRARLAAEEEEEEEPDGPETMRRTLVDGAPLYSQAHPGNPTVTMTWQDEAREQLVRDIELRQNMIDLLARM